MTITVCTTLHARLRQCGQQGVRRALQLRHLDGNAMKICGRPDDRTPRLIVTAEEMKAMTENDGTTVKPEHAEEIRKRVDYMRAEGMIGE